MKTATPDREDEPVPLFGTWRRAYVAVVIALGVNVALLYAVTRWVS